MESKEDVEKSRNWLQEGLEDISFDITISLYVKPPPNLL